MKSLKFQSFLTLALSVLLMLSFCVFVGAAELQDDHEHDYTANEVKFVDPAYDGISYCTDPYYTLGQCACGVIEADVPENRSETIFPPAGSDHKWIEKVLKEPNCGKYGQSLFTCTECGYKKLVLIPPEGKHSWAKNMESPATCISGEQGYFVCEVCGTIEEYSEFTLDPDNHIHVRVRQIYKATDSQEGLDEYYCEDCGETFTETTPMLPSKTASTETVTPIWKIALFFIIGVVGIIVAIPLLLILLPIVILLSPIIIIILLLLIFDLPMIF